MALRALGLFVISMEPGFKPRFKTRLKLGFFPQTHSGKSGGQVHPLSHSIIAC